MHPALLFFIRQYLWVVCAALVPVVMTAFLSIPLSLGSHPGEPRAVDAMVGGHMS
jgi:hypothetical protein